MPVFVTDHAVDRVRQRCPGVGGDVRRLIGEEVSAALLEGRRCVRKPRRLVPSGRRPRSSQPAVRFVWTPSLSRVYVLRRVRSDRGVRGWIVLTAIVPELPPGFVYEDAA